MMILPAWLAASAALAQPTPQAVHFAPRGESGISLEGVLQLPAREDERLVPALVMCHPDPRMSGTMDDRVVAAVTEAVVHEGLAVLRFNFRGVQGSTGAFDNDKGEVNDVLGALDYLARQPGIDTEHLFLGGYSFGSVMALKALAKDERVRAYVGVSLPYGGKPHEREELAEIGKITRPAFVVIGSDDQFGRADAIRELLAEKQAAAQVQVIEGADHFYLDPPEALATAAEAVARFLKTQSAG